MSGKFDKYYDTIDEMVGFLKRDLIGPISDDELLTTDSPDDYYAMGKLWPLPLDEMEEGPVNLDGEYSREEELLDDSLSEMNDKISEVNRYKPSTMGITVVVAPEVTVLPFSFAYGKYTYSRVERLQDVDAPSKHSQYERRYQRTGFSVEGNLNVPNIIKTEHFLSGEEDDIQISITVRKIMNDGAKLITVTASNTKCIPKKSTAINESILFQCKLNLSCTQSFLPVYKNEYQTFDTLENELSKMLYRDAKNYAYGHGCGTHYQLQRGLVLDISSEFMPVELVYQMMPNTSSNPNTMQLQHLMSTSKDVVAKELFSFIEEYKSWLTVQKGLSQTLTGCNSAISYTLDNINTCIARLIQGVNLLINDENAWKSFQYMNESMLLQRVKTKGVAEDTVYWFPFQLAYVLQIIPDIVNKDSSFRNVVDLLWFPTGGGKTEAYLGVAAFTIFYRRLHQKPENDGVTIFMRYTLRLLTVQQFERSAALICACEYLRQKYSLHGGEISIGLWIGSGMTPNHLKEAEERLSDLRSFKPVYEGNPVQVTKCPWCSATIDVSAYTIQNQTMNIRCDNQNCTFHSGLPIYVIDDDIYKKRPTLVLSTVDKFARVTWEPLTANLFSKNGQSPDLIIQDELHLISGPLGSLAGLYEIVLENLCDDNHKPKIIASTATVKQAKEQIKALYNRDFFQFPPNGISSEDSFFAVRAGKEERPARTYLGLCETGGSITDLFIRVFANLHFLKALFQKQGKSNELIDHFYTTVGYFNAIKDLGGSSSILSDRIFTNIKSLVSRKFQVEAQAVSLDIKDLRPYFNHDELTSRKNAQSIKETLERLEVSYPDDKCYSYVLASNMLSVGIDVNRLGVMSVYGQPKSNAEYIQATSRVGRQNPGLVLSLYSGGRSRDKSHYEQFSFYHKSFYQYVEATSVTPFSARALEKALHCVFVSLVRHNVPNMSSNENASNFRVHLSGVAEIKHQILTRVNDILPDAVPLASDWLEVTAATWEELAISNPDTLFYKTSSGISLLYSTQDVSNLPFPSTLNSLRNVEDTANIYLDTR